MRPTKSLKRTNGVPISLYLFYCVSLYYFTKKIQARDECMLIINKLSGGLYLFCCGKIQARGEKIQAEDRLCGKKYKWEKEKG